MCSHHLQQIAGLLPKFPPRTCQAGKNNNINSTKKWIVEFVHTIENWWWGKFHDKPPIWNYGLISTSFICCSKRTLMKLERWTSLRRGWLTFFQFPSSPVLLSTWRRLCIRQKKQFSNRKMLPEPPNHWLLGRISGQDHKRGRIPWHTMKNRGLIQVKHCRIFTFKIHVLGSGPLLIVEPGPP
jgi:hypothetical protein